MLRAAVSGPLPCFLLERRRRAAGKLPLAQGAGAHARRRAGRGPPHGLHPSLAPTTARVTVTVVPATRGATISLDATLCAVVPAASEATALDTTGIAVAFTAPAVGSASITASATAASANGTAERASS